MKEFRYEASQIMDSNRERYYISGRKNFNDFEDFGSLEYVQELAQNILNENGEGEAEIYRILKGRDVTIEILNSLSYRVAPSTLSL